MPPELARISIVAPSKSETGRPILANDPHRQLGVPALRYVVGLNAPGLNIIGAGEPALPGVSIGHNADIAFGITIFAMDQEDLYVYETNPKDPDSYHYGGKWEKMTVEKQTIDVRGQGPREVELKFTRHGPVMARDAASGPNRASPAISDHHASRTPRHGMISRPPASTGAPRR